jgi:error-prone DNA polymerase
MADGREVVEDYRATQLSLRAHPLSFLRDELSRRGVRKCCADLPDIRDGRFVEVAGVILVRQKPGQRQGRVVHHDRGRDRRRPGHPLARPVRGAAPHGHVASMIGMRGIVQKEGPIPKR